MCDPAHLVYNRNAFYALRVRRERADTPALTLLKAGLIFSGDVPHT
jgi:hypothetical protein